MTGASKEFPLLIQVYFTNFVPLINMNLFNILLIKAKHHTGIYSQKCYGLLKRKLTARNLGFLKPNS